jgi:hypothetical protein
MPLAGETGVRGFSKPEEGLLFLMKTVGRSYPTELVFFYIAFLEEYICTTLQTPVSLLTVWKRPSTAFPPFV